MKVIVDTNVLISAVLKGRKPREVIQLISDRADVDWIVSTEILAEYRQVINRGKFKLSEDVRAEWLDKIDKITQLVEVEMKVDFPRDPKDAKFIALAIAIAHSSGSRGSAPVPTPCVPFCDRSQWVGHI